MKLYFYDRDKCHKRADTDRMIRESLERYTLSASLPAFSGKILRTSLGKPFIDYPLFIGVTHTDSAVIIAVGEENFGIDCEEYGRQIKKRDAVASKYFCEGELVLLENATDKNACFLDIWVKKEAYVKFTGEGISGMSKTDTTLLSGFERIENDRNLIIYIYKEQSYE